MRPHNSLLASMLLFAGVFQPAMAGEAPLDSEGAVALADVGTRLQFAFYTGDVPALRRELSRLAPLDAPGLEPLKATYAGYGEWKLAELMRVPDARAAADAARNCTTHLETALAREPERAVLAAMLSVCQRLVSDLEGKVRAPLAATRSRQNLEKARRLAPRDPRVLLIEGINDYEQRRAARESLEPARMRLVAAAAAFDVGYPTGAANDVFADALDWGQPEAWATLGRVHLELGDPVAARDALERALVLVAEYRDARLLLEEITGPRPVR